MVVICTPVSMTAQVATPLTSIQASLGGPINQAKGSGLWYSGPFWILLVCRKFWWIGGWLLSGGGIGSAPSSVVWIFLYLSLLSEILGTGEIMTYMPQALHL